MEKYENQIKRRKDEHLDLCSTDRVSFRHHTTLLENVHLIHQALPELRLSDVDMSVELFGKRLNAPIIIAAMTGGTERALQINQELSLIAEQQGYGFGLGSQRAMQRASEVSYTYQIRNHAPTVLLLGNIGVVQARDCDSASIEKLARDIDADALCIHMNPSMEIVQSEGDRDFTGCIDTFRRLTSDLRIPIVAKETGAGISLQVAQMLKRAGVSIVDVSGAGGTSWVGVEALRCEGDERKLGDILWDWGIPTAASIEYATRNELDVIATGGIYTGLDGARAIAMGAQAVGIARPVLQAYFRGGKKEAENYLKGVENTMATAMLLCGARSIQQMQQVPKVVSGELQDWLALK